MAPFVSYIVNAFKTTGYFPKIRILYQIIPAHCVMLLRQAKKLCLLNQSRRNNSASFMYPISLDP